MGTHTTGRAAPAREVLDALRRIVQVLRESSRRAERRLGVSGAQLFVLEKLAEAPSASLNELAERTHTHQSSVSTVVARLVRRGLVARQRTPGDRRRIRMALTARGRRVIADTPGAAQDRLIEAIEELPPRSARQLASLLRRLADQMDARAHPPRMFFDENPEETRSRDA